MGACRGDVGGNGEGIMNVIWVCFDCGYEYEADTEEGAICPKCRGRGQRTAFGEYPEGSLRVWDEEAA